ncbi:hypothetical protein [Herbiconiux daphne]|uniref:Uncharacterized protein n=1 Tax=Herbiconiux daphne TaxID=2970914 RepID=A0ABT2H3C0_9MICO|nr:hypothetical protein [Herbiconiux daphne]MCS5734440.1 hypothetical protein [Herbiconiux daphne]
MPPRLSAQQMFIVGLALTAAGVVAQIFGAELANSLIGPQGLLAGVAYSVAGLVAQVLLTLGLVLLAVSPLARLIENPPKRPDDRTVLLRETLDRRARLKRADGRERR